MRIKVQYSLVTRVSWVACALLQRHHDGGSSPAGQTHAGQLPPSATFHIKRKHILAPFALNEQEEEAEGNEDDDGDDGDQGKKKNKKKGL